MKVISILIIALMSINLYAHQPDISTSVLSKTAEGQYILQVTSALTAFDGQVDYIYSKGAYNTPDEFKELVIDHFRANVSFIVNQKDTLEFANPIVILGHETKLIVEVKNVPKKIKSVSFKNTMFKDFMLVKIPILRGRLLVSF